MSEDRRQKTEDRDQRPGEGRNGSIGFHVIVSALCLLSSVFCPLVVQAQEPKIGYIDLMKVFDEYERTKNSDAELRQKGQQRDGELKSRLKELSDLRKGRELLNDQAREARERQIDEKQDELERFKTTTVRELGRERERLREDISQDITKAVEEYAQTHGYTLVFNGVSLLYAQPGQDITGDVLKLMNSRYQKAAGR